MKVAVLGGTGPFGSALGARLVKTGIDVTIGSRDPERAAATAALIGAAGGIANVDASRRPTSSCSRRCDRCAADRIRAGRRARRDPSPERRERAPHSDGLALPGPDPLSLAERIQQLVPGPVVAGLHSLAASTLATGKAEGDAFVCGDDATPRRPHSSSPRRSSPAALSTPARSRAPAHSRA
jgi:hypothetical protein